MRRGQEDFEAEVRAHLELEAEALRREGLSPAAAAAAARRRFGNVTQAHESFYGARRAMWLDRLRLDLRYAARSLRRSFGLSLTIVGVLAIGIAATVTISTMLQVVVLRPLPFSRPEQLVTVGVVGARQSTLTASASAGELEDWRSGARSFSSIAAFRVWGYELDRASEPERVVGARVTANLFTTLGVRAQAGRTLAAGDDDPSAQRVVVLSDSLWRSAFGARLDVVGSTINLNGMPYVVVGVADADAMYPRAALWVPYVFAPYEVAQRGDRSVSVVARLRPGVTIARAREDVRRMMREEASTFPAAGSGWEASVVPLVDAIVGSSREALFILFAATCGLLVVVCANVANALSVRLTVRRRELTIRSAIGASGPRLLQQLLTEGALLVGAGGLVALALIGGAFYYLSTFGRQYLPRSTELRFGAEAIAAMGGLLLLIAFLISAVGARHVARMALAGSMRSRGNTSGWGRDLVVASQIAVALVLLIDGWVLVASLRRLQAVDLGFNPAGVATATVSLPGGRYPTGTERIAFFHEVGTRIAAMPSVEAVAIANRVPFTTSATSGIVTAVTLVGSASTDAERPRAATMVVSPSYFDVLGIRIVAGRLFDESDRADKTPVMIVDDVIARQLAPNGRVVGALARLSTIGGDTTARLLVGVVRSVRMMDPSLPPTPLVYLPYEQLAWSSMQVVVRARGAEASSVSGMLRAGIRSVDPTRPVYNALRVESALVDRLAVRRLQTALVAGFAVAALALAVLGIYGIASFTVKQREREFGIRMALGATRGDIARGVLTRSVRLVALGSVVGLPLALAAGILLRGAVFTISPFEPSVAAGALVIVVASALAASYVPASQASRSDPSSPLRAE